MHFGGTKEELTRFGSVLLARYRVCVDIFTSISGSFEWILIVTAYFLVGLTLGQGRVEQILRWVHMRIIISHLDLNIKKYSAINMLRICIHVLHYCSNIVLNQQMFLCR